VTSKAQTVKDYLAELPTDRRAAKTGKKLDMGKGCVRFKKLDDVPLDVIGEAIARVPVQQFISFYESAVRGRGERKRR
jgi:hypothetical protein